MAGEQGGADGDQGDLPAGHAARDHDVDPGTGQRQRRVLVPAGRTGRERIGERGGRDSGERQQGTGQPGQDGGQTADAVHDEFLRVMLDRLVRVWAGQRRAAIRRSTDARTRCGQA